MRLASGVLLCFSLDYLHIVALVDSALVDRGGRIVREAERVPKTPKVPFSHQTESPNVAAKASPIRRAFATPLASDGSPDLSLMRVDHGHLIGDSQATLP